MLPGSRQEQVEDTIFRQELEAPLLTVLRGQAMTVYGFRVGFSPITHVQVPPILGILLRQFLHVCIAGVLGDHAGGSDRPR